MNVEPMYIEPSTLGIALQLLMGAMVSLLILAGVYWRRIRDRLDTIRKKRQNDE